MSWNASFDASFSGKKWTFKPIFPKANTEPVYHADQFDAVHKATLGLIKSGVFGDNTKTYRVLYSGHGNENHEPSPGWANDFVSITITQLPDPVPVDN